MSINFTVLKITHHSLVFGKFSFRIPDGNPTFILSVFSAGKFLDKLWFYLAKTASIQIRFSFLLSAIALTP